MGVYKLSAAGGLATPRTNYSSFLAGNPKVVFPSYESIATVTVGSGGSSTITFSSIPSTFRHLQIRYTARNVGTSQFSNLLSAQFNSDTTSGNYYRRHRLGGRGDNVVYSDSNSGDAYADCGLVAGGGTSSGIFDPGIIDILDYTSVNKNKTIRALSGLAGQSTDSQNDVIFFSSLYFPSTKVAIDRIDLTTSSNFAQYSHFALYGIKGE